jgi:hypothetical protein
LVFLSLFRISAPKTFLPFFASKSPQKLNF